MTPDGAEPFDVREEIISVRFGEDQKLLVRSTRHGPVVSDVLDSAAARAGSDHVISLSAVAPQPGDTTADAIHILQTARNRLEFLRALTFFHAPQQNFVYADASNHIGMVSPARVPIRGGGRGLVPSPGESYSDDWQGFVAFGDLPRQFDPPGDVLLNANNRIVDDDYPHFISADWEPSFRAERIARALGQDEPQTLADSMALQTDSVSNMARDLLPLMLESVRATDNRTSPRVRAVMQQLDNWNFDMVRGTPEPLLFAAWTRMLFKRLVADEMGDSFNSYWNLRPRTIRTILTEAPQWCDDINSVIIDSCSQQARAALDDALEEFSDEYGKDFTRWRWGDAHQVKFLHPIYGFVPGLSNLLGLVADSDGSPFTVMRGGIRFGGGKNPYANNHGAGYRAVYDLSDLGNSYYAMAPGQSGNLFSRFFSQHVEAWANGKYFQIPEDRQSALADAHGVLTLIPGKGNTASNAPGRPQSRLCATFRVLRGVA